MAVFQLQNQSINIKVNSFGAELCSVYSNEYNIEYIWQANQSVWARHAPNLFPIVGKLKDGKFQYKSHSYQLSQHGFARDHEFTCIEQANDYLVFELQSSPQTLVVYPFSFRFQIKYQLLNNKLSVTYSVFNPAESELYFSVGAHPAFNCPLQKDETLEDYNLVFPHKNTLTINGLNDGLITTNTKELHLNDNKLSVSKKLFDNDALVFMNNQVDEVSLISSKTNHGVTLSSLNWPFFGIWTKKDTEQFICLEPWYGIADSDNATGEMIHKTGIIKLLSEQQFDCSFDVLFF